MERLETERGVLLRDQGGLALFDPDTMQLFSLDLPSSVPLAEIGRWLERTRPPSVPAGSAEPPDDPLLLSRRQALLPMLVGEEVLASAVVRPRVNRLTINISNACNLWCSYCYADHGLYHEPKSLMPSERATAVVQKILERYEEVEIVHFFGGEPLLNLAAIDAVGEAFTAAVQSGRLAKLPQFVATTNGTLSSGPILDTLVRWDMELTVSWDGPQIVHDAGRPMAGGKGSSFAKLVKSLERFQQRGIQFGIECTYNAQHVDKGVSVIELMDFFHRMTGLQVAHIAPAMLPSSAIESERPQKVFRGQSLLVQLRDSAILGRNLIAQYRAAAAYSVENVFAGSGPVLSFVNNIVEQIATRRRSLIYCPAFFDQLSIAAEGTAYPCFMFIGDPSFRLGNLLTDEFPTQDGTTVFRRYFQEFGFAPTGTRKWYAPLFGGCVAGEYIATNTLGIRSMAPLYEAMIEECLLGVASYLSQGAPPPVAERVSHC